jgi:hypothetical protein
VPVIAIPLAFRDAVALFELTWTLLLLELSFLKIAFARFRVMRQNQPIIPWAQFSRAAKARR